MVALRRTCARHILDIRAEVGVRSSERKTMKNCGLSKLRLIFGVLLLVMTFSTGRYSLVDAAHFVNS